MIAPCTIVLQHRLHQLGRIGASGRERVGQVGLKNYIEKSEGKPVDLCLEIAFVHIDKMLVHVGVIAAILNYPYFWAYNTHLTIRLT